MNYDARDYEIVQTGPASWGIQYRNGPLEGGFANKQMAMEVAQQTAANSEPFVNPEPRARTVVEAAHQVDFAQTNFLSFLNENPTATAEERIPYTSAINSAQSQLSAFGAADLAARNAVSPRQDFASLDFNQQLRMADLLRNQRLDEAVQIRLTQATSTEVQEADAKAFAAETYYQNLSQSNPANATMGTASTMMATTSARIANPFGNFIQNITGTINGAGNALFGQITNAIGSIGQTITNGGNLLPGSGNSSNIGQNLNNALDNALSGGSGSSSNSSSGSADRRIRLSPKPSIRSSMLSGVLAPLAPTGGLVFPYTPQITYQGRASYNPLKTVHANQDWHIYQNTDSIVLTIQGEFTAQNKAEAEYLLASIHFLRASTKMRFGERDAKRGLPPPQLTLDGYGTHMFNGLSVIVTNYDVGLPNNVDYIDVESGGGVSQVPVHTTITVECVVQQTPKKAREFDWDKFASGDLMKGKGWL